MEENQILNKLFNIEKILTVNNDAPLTFTEAADYLKRSHSNLYKLTSQKKIPFHKPTGKIIYFLKNELDSWIAGKKFEAGRKKGKINYSGTKNKEEEIIVELPRKKEDFIIYGRKYAD